MQPLSDATCTAPHENFSQIETPSTFCASCRVNMVLLEAVPINSLAVGIFAKTSPLALKPLGGHIAFGEGETDTFARGFLFTTAFFFTTGSFTTAFLEVVDLAVVLATGTGEGFSVAACTGTTLSAKAMKMATKRLIAIPLKFTHSEYNASN